jgi:hypothetical protein
MEKILQKKSTILKKSEVTILQIICDLTKILGISIINMKESSKGNNLKPAKTIS